MRLTNEVALITGAASGIGRESALLFAREGARVVADVNDECRRSRRDRVKAAVVEALFPKRGGTLLTKQTNFSQDLRHARDRNS